MAAKCSQIAGTGHVWCVPTVMPKNGERSVVTSRTVPREHAGIVSATTNHACQYPPCEVS
ncbi:unnamed protein product [Clonostachys chloroleuca]|uniref:Uncharacterized protein n=1 Tax=Clonostachys chloroleuca TaxID=1926264 RepID=A0AA35M6H3_9HYPO|nr:unnamed protein product [Clonostachys chloroleuca]